LNQKKSNSSICLWKNWASAQGKLSRNADFGKCSHKIAAVGGVGGKIGKNIPTHPNSEEKVQQRLASPFSSSVVCLARAKLPWATYKRKLRMAKKVRRNSPNLRRRSSNLIHWELTWTQVPTWIANRSLLETIPRDR
jgi:hypothetical protein